MRRVLVLMAVVVTLAGCATPDYWVGPTVTQETASAASAECKRLTEATHPELAAVDFVPFVGVATSFNRMTVRQQFYHDCMAGKGLSRIDGADLEPGQQFRYYWVNPDRPGENLSAEYFACQEVEGSHLEPKSLPGLERCMRAKGRTLWAPAELRDYARFVEAYSPREPDESAFATCMKAADDAIPLSQVRVNDFIGRRAIHRKCMTAKGYPTAGG